MPSNFHRLLKLERTLVSDHHHLMGLKRDKIPRPQTTGRSGRKTSRRAEAYPVEGYLEYEPLTVQKIRQLTSDQPYLIHLMCRAIVDYCNEQHKNYVTINDVNIVQHDVKI